MDYRGCYVGVYSGNAKEKGSYYMYVYVGIECKKGHHCTFASLYVCKGLGNGGLAALHCSRSLGCRIWFTDLAALAKGILAALAK